MASIMWSNAWANRGRTAKKAIHDKHAPLCEECGYYKARIKTEDGYHLCRRCTRECYTRHVKETLPSFAPISKMPYTRPVYIKPAITREDALSRHTVDNSMFAGGGDI